MKNLFNRITLAIRNKEGKWCVLAQSHQLKVNTWHYGACS
ncbi:RHS repeat family [Clostridium botulinum BKT015925]|nr:RHS repeat family [Clostridium botulinum BKT015925]